VGTDILDIKIQKKKDVSKLQQEEQAHSERQRVGENKMQVKLQAPFARYI